MKINRAVTIGVVFIASLGLSATQAEASTTVSVHTTDAGAKGGASTFFGDNRLAVDPAMRTRERLSACDRQADGKRVLAEAQWAPNNYYALEDANGSAGGVCRHVWLSNIREEATVYVRVCLKDGPNGRKEYCSDWKAGRA